MPFAPLCDMIAMPPRTPNEATGSIVAPSVWVATPPTTRNTPLPSERATSPLVVTGLYTKRSMTSVELGPTLSVVLSMNRTCTLPVAVVWIFSFSTTCAPISINRGAAPGGVPDEVVLTAAAAPTVSARAAADIARTAPNGMAANSSESNRVQRIRVP